MPNSSSPTYGLTLENPILLKDISASKEYLRKLAALDEDLSYQRRGSSMTPELEKPVDIYDFTWFGEPFCSVYVYMYHEENIEEIPQEFLDRLEFSDADIDDIFADSEIIDDDEEDEEMLRALMQDEEEDPPSGAELFYNLVQNILSKYGIQAPQETPKPEDWTEEDEWKIRAGIRELGLSPLLEPLLLHEWEAYEARTHRPHREFFVQGFLPAYHHRKLAPWLPEKAQEQNRKLEAAYHGLLEVVNTMQYFAPEEALQERIESDLREDPEVMGLMLQCTTRFCILQLYSDFSGRYNLAYWLDSKILELFPEKPVSTLLRSIYELTPGLDEQVSCRSLNDDCGKLYEEWRERARYEEGHLVVKAT